ncbi:MULTISPECIES: hypothetical protein [Brevibacillus]|uniref:hypothetical protein n=1 Tax=Brevibacillus TaxID=55080 RepID=UPI000D0FB30B|nr:MULTISPECIES: hypothetical protein [Brevibacillus]MED1945679.1 hypothetical protein [Brevibacillus formosus]MED2000688.1 hypothetical protein [Brevibacillus formosus]MED2084466.1 hypothetical protein [Brevibacillus formosus]PSK15658.1 hypothetical protein C7R94_19670 [Brevibacillus sp. NRRL NRS-603]
MKHKMTIAHGKMFYHLDYEPGDTVEWESQAGGSTKAKRGEVLAILPAGRRLHQYLPADTPSSQCKAQNVSAIPRALIEVPRGGKSVKADFYAPHVSKPRFVSAN